MFVRRNTKTTRKSDLRFGRSFFTSRLFGASPWQGSSPNAQIQLNASASEWRDNAQLRIPDYLGVALLPTLNSHDTSRWFYFRFATTNANTIDTMILVVVAVRRVSLFHPEGTTHWASISFRYLYVLVRLMQLQCEWSKRKQIRSQNS